MAFTIFRLNTFLCAFFFIMNPLLLHVLCSCRFSSDIFRKEPSSKIVKEGDYVNFTCVVKNFNPLTDSVIWNFSPDMLNTNVTEIYDTNSNDMMSVIIVHAHRTLQLFSCELHSKTRLCFSSRMASMRVEYFPRERELSCGPRNPRPLQIGDILPTYCRVVRGNPSVDMSWRFVPEAPTVYLPLARDDSFQRVLLYDLSATLQMHKKMIVCEVTSEIVFPDRHLQCLIGPILVLQSPKVMIRPSDAVIQYGKSVQLTCLADGYPDVFNFSWTCLPDGTVTGCDSVCKTANISINKYFDKVVESTVVEISCTASNSQGRSTDSMHASIVFDPGNHSETPISTTVSCPKDFSPQVSVISRNKTYTRYKEIVVLCEVRNVTRQEDIRILWKLGQRNLGEGFIDFSSFQSSSFISHMRLTNLSLGNYDKSIHCMVTICNITHTGSVHLLDMFERFDNDSTSRTISLSITNTPEVLHEDFNASSITLSYSSSHSPVHQFHSPSVFDDLEHFSPFQPSPSKPSPKWSIITFSLLGAVGIVIIISCLVTFISVMVYRHLKNVNQRNMNDFIRELSKTYPITKNDTGVDQDRIYEVPRFESVLPCNEGILRASNPDNHGCSPYSSPSESSGKCSSCTNTSPASSWSNSSGVYLDPISNDARSEIHQDGGKDETFHNVYENERVIHYPPEQGDRLFYKAKDLNAYPQARNMLDIPMPAFPSKTEK